MDGISLQGGSYELCQAAVLGECVFQNIPEDEGFCDACKTDLVSTGEPGDVCTQWFQDFYLAVSTVVPCGVRTRFRKAYSLLSKGKLWNPSTSTSKFDMPDRAVFRSIYRLCVQCDYVLLPSVQPARPVSRVPQKG